jgi:hypothetical protein
MPNIFGLAGSSQVRQEGDFRRHFKSLAGRKLPDLPSGRISALIRNPLTSPGSLFELQISRFERPLFGSPSFWRRKWLQLSPPARRRNIISP